MHLSVFVCVYRCMCAHVYICVLMHAGTHVHSHTCVRMCAHTPPSAPREPTVDK